MARFGFVTCSSEKLADYFPTIQEPNFLPTEPPFTPEDQLVVDSLRALGHAVEPVIWGTDPADLERFEMLVMRSPWDYMDSTRSRREFVAWLSALQRARIPIQNTPELMLWLSDKRYLLEFESRGVPIVETRFLPAGTSLESLQLERPSVFKPTVSGAGQGLFFVPNQGVAPPAGLREALQENDYLLQPFVPEIRTTGEWSLIAINSRYSHAALKKPGKDSILVHAEQGGSLAFEEPPNPVRELAEKVLDALHSRTNHKPLYLRVDVIETSQGPLLSECEGVEPELFFRACPGSEMRFARALEEYLKN